MGSSQEDYAGHTEPADLPFERSTSMKLDSSAASSPEPLWADSTAIVKTIETDIIPRLLLLHRDGPPRHRLGRVIAEGDVTRINMGSPLGLSRFLRILLDGSPESAMEFVDEKLAAGAPFEAVILDLLNPTAVWLGALWEQDRLSFVEVTIAMSRLQRLIRSFAPDLAPLPRFDQPPRRCYLAAVPGETHTFGAAAVEAFLLRDGWDVVSENGLDRDQILDRVAGDWFDVVGLTVNCDGLTAQLPGLCRDIRAAARNRGVKIMIGGRIFVIEPKLALDMGADLETVRCEEIGAMLESITAAPGPA